MAEQDPSLLATNEKASSLITEEDVKHALRNDKGPEAVFKSFKTVDFTTRGDNYACFVTSVEVEYRLRGQDCFVSYVVKVNPCASFDAFQGGTALLFLKEASFYGKIAPRLNDILTSFGYPRLRIPDFYYASYEPKKEMIFLEDMRKKGYKMHDRKKAMNVDHVMLVLPELARLHAAGNILLKNEGLDIIPKFNLDKEFWTSLKDNEPMQDFVKNCPLNVAKLIGPLGPYDKVVEALHQLSPDTYWQMIGQVVPEEPFATICHGDCWNNNLLFRYEDGKPVEVCLLDLQLNRHSSAATDLRYFLSASPDSNTRTRHIDHFLSTYFTALKECMEAGGTSVPFSKEAFCEEYRSKAKFGLIVGMMIIPGLLIDASDAVDFSKYSEEELKQVMADSEADFLKLARNNPIMKERLLGFIDEMTEEGVLPK